MCSGREPQVGTGRDGTQREWRPYLLGGLRLRRVTPLCLDPRPAPHRTARALHRREGGTRRRSLGPACPRGDPGETRAQRLVDSSASEGAGGAPQAAGAAPRPPGVQSDPSTAGRGGGATPSRPAPYPAPGPSAAPRDSFPCPARPLRARGPTSEPEARLNPRGPAPSGTAPKDRGVEEGREGRSLLLTLGELATKSFTPSARLGLGRSLKDSLTHDTGLTEAKGFAGTTKTTSTSILT